MHFTYIKFEKKHLERVMSYENPGVLWSLHLEIMNCNKMVVFFLKENAAK
jgi:hypothetical protein